MIRIVSLAALLTACGPKYVMVEKPIITRVEVRVECPSAEERQRLRDARPKQLRNDPMPTDPVERSGRSQAQLGKYEAPGGYADQVEAALDRCQK